MSPRQKSGGYISNQKLHYPIKKWYLNYFFPQKVMWEIYIQRKYLWGFKNEVGLWEFSYVENIYDSPFIRKVRRQYTSEIFHSKMSFYTGKTFHRYCIPRICFKGLLHGGFYVQETLERFSIRWKPFSCLLYEEVLLLYPPLYNIEYIKIATPRNITRRPNMYIYSWSKLNYKVLWRYTSVCLFKSRKVYTI